MDKILEMINNAGVVYFRSSEITTPHGFSTRYGGVSDTPHLATMNFGKNLADKPENVEENYRRIAKAIGFDPGSLVYTKQVHSANVRAVGRADIGRTYECDGFVSNEKGVAFGICTADCVPILMYDPIAGVIGAVHAGWRGTANRIQQNAVTEMCKLGAHSENIKVAIGACIHKCCYKVGEDFRNTLYDLLGKELTDRHLSEDMYCDLVSLNTELLEQAGIKSVSASQDCTCCKSDLYFSHRASGGKRGLMSAFISL